jgi:hypothetical protein
MYLVFDEFGKIRVLSSNLNDQLYELAVLNHIDHGVSEFYRMMLENGTPALKLIVLVYSLIPDLIDKFHLLTDAFGTII